MGKCSNVVKCYGDCMYLVARILVGLMFLSHGGQKLFGWLGGQSVSLMSMMGLAGVVEVVVGLAVTLGIFVRLLAPIGALQMLAAFFIAHFPSGWNPMLNGGELPLLYLSALLLFTISGNGKWNLEKTLMNKETF